jgi:predicted heme/steroid binding protein
MKQNYTLKDIINQYQKEICYYNQMQITAVSAYEKNYYHGLIKERTESFIHMMEQQVMNPVSENPMNSNSQTTNSNNESNSQNSTIDSGNLMNNVINDSTETEPSNNIDTTKEQPINELIELTPDELATFNGKNGMPIYVAVNGNIYDVTTAPAWFGGMHFAGLTGGKDLTDKFLSCHKNMITVLDKYPKVGILKTETVWQ